MDKNKLLTYYRRQSVDRERMYAKPFRRYQQRRRLEVVRELLLVQRGRRDGGLLLDVGCGDGYGIATILEGLEYPLLVGLDLSPEKLRTAGQNLRASRMVLGDAEELPLAATSFEAVFSLETLEHLHGPAAGPGRIRPGARARGAPVYLHSGQLRPVRLGG